MTVYSPGQGRDGDGALDPVRPQRPHLVAGPGQGGEGAGSRLIVVPVIAEGGEETPAANAGTGATGVREATGSRAGSSRPSRSISTMQARASARCASGSVRGRLHPVVFGPRGGGLAFGSVALGAWRWA